MNGRAANIEDEISSIGRRADQMCTMHAFLRDRYAFRAQLLDYGLMAASTYLLVVSIVEPLIGVSLSFGIDPKVLIPGLSLVTFFLSVIQFKSDWKTRAQEHADAMSKHAAVKSDCRAVERETKAATAPELLRIRSRYDMIGETGAHIPENQFLKGKARHARKVYLSKYLDSHPGAWPGLVSLKLFLRDNLGINLLNSHSHADDTTNNQGA
jgi:hypothetical protein